MFTKGCEHCSCLIIAIFWLSIAVIYASHICGLCPAGFFHNGCLSNSTSICQRCPKGTYNSRLNAVAHCTKCSQCLGRNNIVVNKCNATHNTECRCRDGYFFDKTISLCNRCSKCVGKNNILVRRCHGTHNTVCRCKDGYYFDTGLLYCARCSHCKRGQGVVKNCTRKANTQCEKCVKGLSFSPVRSKTEPCHLCKLCGENEEIEKECTRRKDRVCKAIPRNKLKDIKLKNKSRWPESFNDETTKVPKLANTPTETLDSTKADNKRPTSGVVGARKRTERKDKSEMTTLIIVIVGVVFGLAALVCTIVLVFKWRKNRTTTSDTHTTIVESEKDPSYLQNQQPSPRQTKRTTNNRLSRTPLMTGSTELLRNANFSIIGELSECLNPKGRWKTLAGKLGFKSKDIENFDIEPSSATERMLSEWSHQKDSTVQKLHDVLLGMRWNHEADIVCKHMNSA